MPWTDLVYQETHLLRVANTLPRTPVSSVTQESPCYHGDSTAPGCRSGWYWSLAQRTGTVSEMSGFAGHYFG